MLEQHASDSQLTSVVRADDQRTDLHRLLLLLYDVDEADRQAVLLGDKHVLPRREVTDVVDTSFHMRVEDPLRVSAVVATVERTQSPNHEVSHPLEVISHCGADDDFVIDQGCGQGAPPNDCYDFSDVAVDRTIIIITLISSFHNYTNSNSIPITLF